MSSKKKSNVRSFPLSFLSKPTPTITAVSERLTSDRKRRVQKKSHTDAPSPRKRAATSRDSDDEDISAPIDAESDFVDVDLAGPPLERGQYGAERVGKRKRTKKFYPSVRLVYFRLHYHTYTS